MLTTTDDFAWNLIQALYSGTPYPPVRERADRLAFQRLFELAELALQQLSLWKDGRRGATAPLLGSIDDLLVEVSALNANVRPVVEWFQTQRLRLGPADAESTLADTRRLFEELLWITAVYYEPQEQQADARRALELCARCAPELREYAFASIESAFHELLSRLHALARHSATVGELSWSAVLEEIRQALARQDYIALADLFEYSLGPQLNRDFAGRQSQLESPVG